MTPEQLEKERLALEYEEKLRIQKEEEGLRKKMIQQTLASSKGEETLFKTKLTKEERKAQQAAKRAAKKNKEAAAESADPEKNGAQNETEATSKPKPAKKDKVDKVAASQKEVRRSLLNAQAVFCFFPNPISFLSSNPTSPPPALLP